jgi:FAD/FMN-containing dehydrogenase
VGLVRRRAHPARRRDVRRAPQGLEAGHRSVTALIARCRGVADVIAAIRFARCTALPVAVRGGGHSYPGHSVCDAGIVIDLGLMTGVRVDPQGRTARVQAGVLWGELDRATQAFGLATTGGFVGHTGVAGLTLGGGIGWLHRSTG